MTITTYASWFYGFGVLISPINEDLGWSTTALGLTYGAAQALAGIGAFGAGRLLDRVGAVGPFGLQAVVGGGLLLGATWASDVVVFGIMYAIGAGVVGATGFYHVTTVAAARMHPTNPARAIAVLTLIGAFCSPIMLPITAWVAETMGWRPAGRMLALVAIGGALVGAGLGRRAASTGAAPSRRPLAALRRALRDPRVRRMFVVYTAAGVAYASVLVYQVPIMTAAGLSLGLAGTLAGFRGLCQILGRVGLTGALDRWGSRRLLRAAYAVSTGGVALLLIGEPISATAFAVIAGAGIGATSPLQAIHAQSVFDEGDLGLLMGMQGAVVGIAGGVGPVLGGVLQDSTGSWSLVVIAAAVALAIAALLLRPDDAIV